MDLSNLSTEAIAAIVTGLLGLLGAGGGAKVYLPKIVAFVRELSTAINSVNGIKAQFENNGGSTLKDAIDNLQKSVLRIEQRQIMGEQRTKALMNSDPTKNFFEANEKGECLWASVGYLRLTGKSLEDVRGNGWIGVIAPEDRKRVVEEWSDAVTQNRDFQSRYRMLSVDGNTVPVKCTSSVMRNDSHVGVGYMGSVIVLGEDEKFSCREDSTHTPTPRSTKN